MSANARTMPDDGLDADVVRLASMPAMTPGRLHWLLKRHRPAEVIDLLRRGGRFHADVYRHTRGIGELGAQLQRADPERHLARCAAAGVRLLTRWHREYPEALRDDREAPEVLYVQGDLGLLGQRRVGIIGTRNATAAGRATAVELGGQLAAAGVTVVSGLARGIDGCAHDGVRRVGGSGGAAAVVGSGHDVPYPKRNTDLWNWVAEHGVLLSEWPPGTRPEGWRFPLRNRIIAGLSEVLIVVESRKVGGSMLTVDDAHARGIEIMAVPGSMRCRMSEGTNHLLQAGAHLVSSTDDVLTLLGMTHTAGGWQLSLDVNDGPRSGLDAEVLAACYERPVTVDALIDDLGVGVTSVAMALARLEQCGLVHDVNGWFEAVGSRLESTPADRE